MLAYILANILIPKYDIDQHLLHDQNDESIIDFLQVPDQEPDQVQEPDTFYTFHVKCEECFTEYEVAGYVSPELINHCGRCGAIQQTRD